MISGVNQTKNIVTPLNSRKYGMYTWGDIVATWGDSLSTWGDLPIVPINQTKNIVTPTNQTKN